MFRSTDGGASWSANDLSFSVNSFLQSGSSILAATQQGIYLSKNNGATWALAATGMLPDTNPAYAFGMIDSTIYISTANGIWKQQRAEIPFSVANSSVAEVADHEAIELSPNPTSGTLTIQGAVNSITVTNLLGETVLDVPNPHSQEVTLDLSKLPAGTYFARIATADGTIMRKILKQ